MKFRHAILVLLCTLFFAPAAHAQPLRIAYPDFEPFFHRSDDGRMQGLFYEIVTEALRREGIKARWEAFPWARCQVLVQVGAQDAMVTVPTAERAAYTVTHARPFYRKAMNVFTYAGHPRMHEILALRSIADIRNAGFTVITYTTNGWSKDNLEAAGVRVMETPTLPSIWLMLANRRGDLAIEWPPGAWPDIRAYGLADKVVQTDIELASMPFHLLVGKACPLASDIVRHFDQTIQAMRDDGTMKRILKKYR